jgi:nucleotide-binding universal stress UspA family protein
VNYTGVSGRAFAHSIALASAFGATLVAVHIIEKSGADVDEEAERLRAWARNDTVSVESRILVLRRKASTILLEYLRESGADLVVVGARRRIFQKRTTLGSTTNAITHRARCPVLTVSETPADRE